MAKSKRGPEHARQDTAGSVTPDNPDNNDTPFVTGYASYQPIPGPFSPATHEDPTAPWQGLSPAFPQPLDTSWPPKPMTQAEYAAQFAPPTPPQRAPLFRDDGDPAPARPRSPGPGPGEETELQKVLRERWNVDEITWLYLQRLRQVADLNSAKGNEKGFTLETTNGSKIKWEPFHSDGEGKPAREAITGDKNNFDLNAAHTIIALARVRGWDKIDVQGTPEQKDMLWFAVQVQGLREREQNLAAGNPDSEFKAPSVANHTPPLNSKYRQEWEKMLADWESRNRDKIDGPGPGATESAPVPGASPAPAPAGPVPPDTGRPRPDTQPSRSGPGPRHGNDGQEAWLQKQREIQQEFFDFLDAKAEGRIPQTERFKKTPSYMEPMPFWTDPSPYWRGTPVLWEIERDAMEKKRRSENKPATDEEAMARARHAERKRMKEREKERRAGQAEKAAPPTPPDNNHSEGPVAPQPDAPVKGGGAPSQGSATGSHPLAARRDLSRKYNRVSRRRRKGGPAHQVRVAHSVNKSKHAGGKHRVQPGKPQAPH